MQSATATLLLGLLNSCPSTVSLLRHQYGMIDLDQEFDSSPNGNSADSVDKCPATDT